MRYVALTCDGRVLRRSEGEGSRHLRADGTAVDADAVFERIDLSHGRVALRAPDGGYLSLRRRDGTADGRDQRSSVHLTDELTSRAAFEELPHVGGEVALRTCEGRYVGLAADGLVRGDRISAGSWERFGYLAVPSTRVPAQTGAAQTGASRPSSRPSTRSGSAALIASTAPA